MALDSDLSQGLDRVVASISPFRVLMVEKTKFQAYQTNKQTNKQCFYVHATLMPDADACWKWWDAVAWRCASKVTLARTWLLLFEAKWMASLSLSLSFGRPNPRRRRRRRRIDAAKNPNKQRTALTWWRHCLPTLLVVLCSIFFLFDCLSANDGRTDTKERVVGCNNNNNNNNKKRPGHKSTLVLFVLFVVVVVVVADEDVTLFSSVLSGSRRSKFWGIFFCFGIELFCHYGGCQGFSESRKPWVTFSTNPRQMKEEEWQHVHNK